MRYLMGIDSGGTFSKVAIFDEYGTQMSSVSIPTKMITPRPGYTERDMDELWDATAKAIKKSIEQSGISAKEIVGISFSGHGKGLYMVGHDGKPSYHGILSTDTRAWEYVKKWEEDGTKEKIYPRTYQTVLASQPVALLRWFLDNKPQIIEKTKYIFHVKDYIRYMLTGEAYAEYTDSTGGNLVNLNTKKYDLELLKYFGVDTVFDKLPPLKYSADICGYVTEEAAAKTGLMPGTLTAAGMFDVDACGLASGLIDEEHMCTIAGTWSINEFIAKEPVTNGSADLNSYFCIPGFYLVEESSPTSAGNMEWFIRNLMKEEKIKADSEEKSVYDITNAWVSSIEPQESDLIFLPFLNGSGEDPLAKGSFIGLTAYHDKKHMLRAVYEGIVFSHYTHIERLLRIREQPKSICLSGGVANSEVWLQIFADVFQMPIDVVGEKESGAQGAAIAAGIAAGIYTDYEDAVKKVVKITKTVMPREEYKEVYEKKYHRYRTIVEKLEQNGVWDCFI